MPVIPAAADTAKGRKMEEFVQRVGILGFAQFIIELWNSLFLLIMIFSLLLGRHTDRISGNAVKIPLTEEIIIFYISIFLYNLFDMLCCLGIGNTSRTAIMLRPVFEMAYFAVGAFLTLFFLRLIKKHIAVKNGMKKLADVITAVQLLNIPSIVLLAATPFTNALYRFDAQNMYHRGEFYPVWYFTTIGSFVFIIAVIALNWKKLDRFIKNVVITSSVIPLSAFLANFVYSGISYNNISVSATALILYVMYEKNKTAVTIQAVTELEETKRRLAESDLALEQSKNETLMAQIQPHFINNSLMAIRSQCVDHPEVYESITNFSLYLRSNFEALGGTQKISFDREMESIEAYLALEQQNFGDRLTVEYDIQCDDFFIPPLTVQPLVENAVRHGIATRDNGGTVWIKTRRSGNAVTIEVIDDGIGSSNITVQQQARKGIGIENVRARLRSMNSGDLEIISGENGTSAIITFTDRGGVNKW